MLVNFLCNSGVVGLGTEMFVKAEKKDSKIKSGDIQIHVLSHDKHVRNV